MSTKYKIALVILVLICIASVLAFAAHGDTFALLQPKGIMADRESRLMLTAFSILALGAIPTYFFLFYILWKFRAGNEKASYEPEHDKHTGLQIFLWAVPIAIIFSIAVLNLRTTFALDPYRPLDSTTTPLTIQVVSLRWKWLFIYPEQHIATVNLMEIPEHTPINLELTSDGLMNSFYVPQLSGQIYTMAAMSTQLHIEADTAGDFDGKAAEINGAGYAGMKFTVRSVSNDDFDAWVAQAKKNPAVLDTDTYEELAEPSQYNPVAVYGSTTPDLYTMIMMKYMSPDTTLEKNDSSMTGMDMDNMDDMNMGNMNM